jgi:glycosyltransferase 2 family protein
MKNILKYIVSLGIAGGLLWFTFKDIDLLNLFHELGKADIKWIVVSGLLAVVAHGSRALRWKMLLEPLGYKPSTINIVLAVWVGYFMNFLIPRAGEVSRCGTLQRTDGVPFDKSFGTVVTERVFDVLTLLVIIALNFLLEFDRLSQFFIDFFADKLAGKTTLLSMLAIVGVLGLLLIWVFRKKILQNAMAQKIWIFLDGLIDGAMSIKHLRSPSLFLFHTILIWVMYYLMSYCLFFALPQSAHLGLLAGLTILVVGAIGMATPTPGGVGSFHILVSQAMGLYGLSTEDGKLLATFFHGSQMLTVLLLGGLSFIIVILFRQKMSDTQ